MEKKGRDQEIRDEVGLQDFQQQLDAEISSTLAEMIEIGAVGAVAFGMAVPFLVANLFF